MQLLLLLLGVASSCIDAEMVVAWPLHPLCATYCYLEFNQVCPG
jgi:hypothetical protein